MSADFWGLKTAGGTATAYHLLAAMLAKSHALEVRLVQSGHFDGILQQIRTRLMQHQAVMHGSGVLGRRALGRPMACPSCAREVSACSCAAPDDGCLRYPLTPVQHLVVDVWDTG